MTTTITIEPIPTNFVDATSMSPAALGALLDAACDGKDFEECVVAARIVESTEAMAAGDFATAAGKAHAVAPREPMKLGEGREVRQAGHDAATEGDEPESCPHGDRLRAWTWFDGFLDVLAGDGPKVSKAIEARAKVLQWIDMMTIQIGAEIIRNQH